MKKTFNRVKKPSKNSVEDNEIEELAQKLETCDWSEWDSFDSIPLSRNTLNGLNQNGFIKPTDIQKEAIGLGLRGEDVLGAAKTGSGKTLAFLVPVLECLYRHKWTQYDGMGALIITPTRELSYQIFEVLRKVGANHDLSAALVIGGKDLKFEQKRMDKCNILICTPGRLLDHMDKNPLFSCDNLKILVLDEADKCLDMGFADTMNAIIANLPPNRQTFLFSATQTKSVKDLVRLSLSSPKYVSVHETSQYSTPDSLVQSYIVCELNQKLNMLWSFIKIHMRQKILVFMSTCKQVKYAYELFCRMRPGMSLLALYGSLHQLRRMAIYDEFCRKQNVILFATDIASRGLDFPSVNWVIQLDCPEDVNTYIHRVGRTARYEESGESLLVLLPNEEESMIKQLTDKKIPINMISVNETKMYWIQRKAEALCARDKNLKESAQRAFKSYIKNVFLMKDKSIFNVEYLDFDLYARSMGLAVTPRVRFVEKSMKFKLNANKNQIKNMTQSDQQNTDDLNFKASDSESENSDQLFSVKKVWRFDLDDESNDDNIVLNEMPAKKEKKAVTKAALVKKILKRKFKPNTRIVYDDEGVVTNGEFPTRQVSDKIKMLEERNISGIDIEIAKQIMKDEDSIDKNLYRSKVKDKHKKERLKLKEEKRRKREERNMTAVLDNGESSDADFEEATNKFIDELPDPDVVYDNQNDGNEEIDSETDFAYNLNKEHDKNANHTKFKQRNNDFKYKNTNQKLVKNTDLGLEECEQFAMHLINS